ncbi:unnamed protein product [Urochloa humidicola]
MADENTQAGQMQGQATGQTAPKMSRRRSPVYEHFICFKDAQGNDRARCKYCGLELGANTKNGTSNLRTHVKICKARHPMSLSLPQQLQLQPSGSGLGESSDREPACIDEARRDLARMIALHGYDPSIVEDDYFKSFLRRLNPGFEVPSREAIDKVCSHIFEDSRSDMYLSNHGIVSLAVGVAETFKTGQVVYVTVHYIDHHWNLHRVVENVFMVSPVDDHYNVPLGNVRVALLDDLLEEIVGYNPIDSKLMLQYEVFMIAGEITGHINHLNLNIRLKDCIWHHFGNKICSATYMDCVLHSIARCLLPDSHLIHNAFIRVETIAYILSQGHKEILTQVGLLDDPWEYGERWYLCFCSFEILLNLSYELDSDTESGSDSVVLLCTLWREIYRAIKTVSDSSRPTSNLCFQELFKVRDVLQSQLSKAPDEVHADNYNGFGDKTVADVLREALETVDKAIQDSYLVWSIPLVLDPRYKLRYIEDKFERAFGSEAEKYVSEVRRKTKELYSSYTKDDDGDSGAVIEIMDVDNSNPPSEQAWHELDGYLQDGPARSGTEGFDILNWWKVHGSVQYPTVARMARDALAMPTCSKLTSDQMAHVRSMIRGYRRIE